MSSFQKLQGTRTETTQLSHVKRVNCVRRTLNAEKEHCCDCDGMRIHVCLCIEREYHRLEFFEIETVKD